MSAMKAMIQAGKTLLNALAFANVNNLGEFRALLRQVERPAAERAETVTRSEAAAADVVHGGL
jgi:hypothetical protein